MNLRKNCWKFSKVPGNANHLIKKGVRFNGAVAGGGGGYFTASH